MIVEIQIGEGAVFNKLIYGCLVNPHDSASERPSCLKFKGFDREMHTLVVVSDAVKKRVETTYEENANRDAEVPVGVGGAGAVNITLAVALAEGRNAVKRSPSLGEGGPSVSEGPKIHVKKTGMSEQLVRMPLTTLFLIGLLS